MPLVTRQCLECHEDFQVSQSEVNRGNGRFCSLSCVARTTNRRRKRKQKHTARMVTLLCQQCGKEYQRKATYIKKLARKGQVSKYCSRACLNKAKKRYITFVCKNCGAQVSVSPLNGKDRKFCSVLCFHQFRHKNRRLPIYKLRFQILARDHFQCQYCGRSPRLDSNVILHIDHIVPRTLGGTTSADNLITACQECNIGKGSTLLDTIKVERTGVEPVSDEGYKELSSSNCL